MGPVAPWIPCAPVGPVSPRVPVGPVVPRNILLSIRSDVVAESIHNTPVFPGYGFDTCGVSCK